MNYYLFKIIIELIELQMMTKVEDNIKSEEKEIYGTYQKYETWRRHY